MGKPNIKISTSSPFKQQIKVMDFEDLRMLFPIIIIFGKMRPSEISPNFCFQCNFDSVSTHINTAIKSPSPDEHRGIFDLRQSNPAELGQSEHRLNIILLWRYLAERLWEMARLAEIQKLP
jgi:hypothetical protein